MPHGHVPASAPIWPPDDTPMRAHRENSIIYEDRIPMCLLCGECPLCGGVTQVIDLPIWGAMECTNCPARFIPSWGWRN